MARRLAELPTEANIDLDPRLFNKVYMPMIFGEGGKIWIKPYNALYGGSGSGKSFSIGQMFAVHMTIMPGRNLVCLRKQKTDCIASCWAFVYNALRKFKLLQFWDIKVNPEHRMINRINGNEILFEGVDDIENIKSIQFTKKFDDVEGGDNLTDVWYEEVSEETDVEVIREIDRRLRDSFVNTRIVLSFNPVSRLHWLYDLVMHEWRMDGMDSYVLKTTYKDNKFLPASYGEKMERLKYTNPYAYQVYALGNWGVMGESVFNQNKIAERLRELQEKYTLTPYKLATFDYTLGDKKIPDPNTFKIRESKDGEIKIFAMPISGRPYVCAVDTAGEGSDYYAAHVCDNVTGEEVAVYHSNKKPDICVWQVYGLCKMYNYALFCPESNFDSWPIHAFLMLDYPNMYRRMGATDKTHIRREDRYGFRTGVDNRQMMLTDMVSFTEHHMDLINDEDTLNEMLTFTRQEKKLKGIWWGAEAGAHDDLCFVKGTLILTDKGQVPIEKIKIGDMVLTRDGYMPVENTMNRCKKVVTNIGLTGTPNHPVITPNGEIPLELVKDSDTIYMWDEKRSAIKETHVWNAKRLFTMGKNITGIQNQNEDNLESIIGGMTNGKNLRLPCIGKYGLITLAKFLKDTLFIIKIKTLSIIQLTIWNVLQSMIIVQDTCFQKKDVRFQKKLEKNSLKELKENSKNGVKKIQKKHMRFIPKTGRIRPKEEAQGLQNGVKKIQKLLDSLYKKTEGKQHSKDGAIKRVYNLQVHGTHEYFANNVLVHNCMSYAIMLQARSQQTTEMVSDPSILEGYWTREELQDAHEEGRIDYYTMQEYIRTHDLYMESGEERNIYARKRVSRYAR